MEINDRVFGEYANDDNELEGFTGTIIGFDQVGDLNGDVRVEWDDGLICMVPYNTLTLIRKSDSENIG